MSALLTRLQQSVSTEQSALLGGPLTYRQFRKLYPATRNLQRYSSETRADRAASHRLGHRQRQAVGEYFYTHTLCPDIAFDTAKRATQEAYAIYLCQFAEPPQPATEKIICEGCDAVLEYTVEVNANPDECFWTALLDADWQTVDGDRRCPSCRVGDPAEDAVRRADAREDCF